MDNFIREAAKTVGPLGGAWMMHGDTGQRGAEVGLNFFEFYVLGRGGPLGDVDGGTIVDAFYFFEPTRLAQTWNEAKQKIAPEKAAQHYGDACAAWGRERLASIDGLDDFSKRAERVIEANQAPGALFHAWRTMPLPDDRTGRAMLLLNVLREMRGGAHIEAVKQLGVDRKLALATNSPGMYQLFGWTDEMPTPDADATERAEALTDEIQAPAYDVLDESERGAFLRVLANVSAATS